MRLVLAVFPSWQFSCSCCKRPCFIYCPSAPLCLILTLVLCVYLGLYHPTVGAALGSFLLGYSIDIVSSRIIGLNAFAMSLVFLTVYLSSRAIWLQHPLVSSLVVLLAVAG